MVIRKMLTLITVACCVLISRPSFAIPTTSEAYYPAPSKTKHTYRNARTEDFFFCVETSSTRKSFEREKIPVKNLSPEEKIIYQSLLIQGPFEKIIASGVITKTVLFTHPGLVDDKRKVIDINAYSLGIRITSLDDANDCFNIIEKLMHNKNYNDATYGLDLLISSIIEETLPYSEDKFEAYKNMLCTLAKYSPIWDQENNSDGKLNTIAGKIISFISEKQHDFIKAQIYGKQLINAFMENPNDYFFLGCMINTWKRLYKNHEQCGECITFLQEAFEKTKKLDGKTTKQKASALFKPLVIASELLEFMHENNFPATIAYGKKTVDWSINTQIPYIKRFIKKHYEFCKELLQKDLDVDKKDQDENPQPERAEQIAQLENALHNGHEETSLYLLMYFTRENIMPLVFTVIKSIVQADKKNEAKAYLKNICQCLLHHNLASLIKELEEFASKTTK